MTRLIDTKTRPLNTSSFSDPNVWYAAWSLVSAELRRSIWLIIFLAVLLGIAGVVLRSVVPPRYVATADLMIDPRGFQVFENDLTSGPNDANAAVNYVESQMHVLKSATVLTRAYRYLHAENNGTTLDEPVSLRAIEELRKSISVKRAERSYILNISAHDDIPERAALVANSVVKAFLDEDLSTRESASGRLNSELTSRLDQLRERVAQSEAAIDEYNRTNNLVTVDGRLVVEHQLADAVKALGTAEERLSAVQALAEQQSDTDVESVLSMAKVTDNPLIGALLARRTAAREEIALLSTRLGNQHPSLRSARSQAQEIDRLIDIELDRIRNSVSSELSKIKEERDNLAETVKKLSEQSTKLRSLSIGLRQLEQQLETDKALLASFELRARQTDEFGKIDSANMRLISQAYAPPVQQGLGRYIPWAVVGIVLGCMLGIGIVVLRSLIRMLTSWNKREETEVVPVMMAPELIDKPLNVASEASENYLRARSRLLAASANRTR